MVNKPVSASCRPRGVLSRPSAKVLASLQTNMFIHKEEDTTEIPMPRFECHCQNEVVNLSGWQVLTHKLTKLTFK